jgi:hypothetical protein
MKNKNSSDTIRNRTHDLLTCSLVPQPTAPPRTPQYSAYFLYLSYKTDILWINIGLLVPHFGVSDGMGNGLLLKVNMKPEQGTITIPI